jgi:hypothetical protein
LVFGADVHIPLATGSLSAAFPAPIATASGSAGVVVLGSMQATAIMQASATGAAQYMSLTQRPTVSRARALHQDATEAMGGIAAHHQDGAGLSVPTAAQHQDGTGLQGGMLTQHQDGTGLHAHAQPQHQDASPVQQSAGFPHQDGTAIHMLRTSRHQDGKPLIHYHRAQHQPAAHRRKSWRTQHQDGRTPPPGRSVFPVAPPVPPFVGNPHLVFACPPWTGGAVHLVFGHVCALPTAPIYILPARYYMAVHTLTAHRLPDLQPVPIFGVSLSADAGSFAWTFSATAPASVFEQLAPASGLPARVRITLDGLPFVFLVDSLQREGAFGKRSVRISGRSATALLARPYARETARLSADTATAQQLAEAALEYTGAALDWGITDWLVPAGAWSHTGTPLAAVQAIAEAAGGYVQSHRSAATLLVRHPYPELPGGIPGGPWNWASTLFAADVELAPDAIITSGIERRDGPDINAVWVSGTNQGVLARVKRTGTAADKLASLITDPLITATEAAQQRGLSVLGAAGPKHLVQIELPILTGAGQPGVLDVGQLVQINEASPWRGRVRSVSVNATMPKARQTIQLERHLEIA